MDHLIFDIGCFYGEWIEANYKDDTLFVGFDGNLKACKVAREKFKDVQNVQIMNLLVSDKIGRENFYITEGLRGSTASIDWINRSRHKDFKYNDPIKVDSTTLDILINIYGKPDYIKIDVEGYELKVIKGLTQKVELIAFEWVEEFKEDVIESVQYLYKLGYEGFQIICGDDYKYIPQQWKSYEEFINLLEEELVPERKQGWGMIYAK